MLPSTLATAGFDPARLIIGGDASWQARTAGGQRIWSWIAWAFAFYWVLFVAGAFLGRKELNSLGGVVILGVLSWATLERLWVRVDTIFLVSVTAALLPVMHLLSSPTPDAIEAYVKYVSVCIVMALARLLQLPEAWTSQRRGLLAAGILAILLISMTIYRGGAWDGGTRHSGLFPNPNNLALIPFLLLFLVDQRRDNRMLRVGVHGMVMLVLAFTGTSGAIMAYAIGIGSHLSGSMQRNWRTLFYGLAGTGVLAAALLFATDSLKILPETRFTNQITVIRSEFGNVLKGETIAYYSQERVLGPGSGSALWRLAHWRHTLAVYGEGTLGQKLFGFGPGSTTATLGILPHNEYIRLLFETGVAGFGLFVFAWYRMIRQAPVGVRYVGLIIAIYSFSENNLDNFPFMSLLILCLSAVPSSIADSRPTGEALRRFAGQMFPFAAARRA